MVRLRFDYSNLQSSDTMISYSIFIIIQRFIREENTIHWNNTLDLNLDIQKFISHYGTIFTDAMFQCNFQEL